MGLLDVLNGMQNGPRGPSNPIAQSSGGMSPMTMAILGLLAWKAFKHMSRQASRAPRRSGADPLARGRRRFGWQSRAVASAMSSRAASAACWAARPGSVLSGGLGDLLNQLQQGGHGETANTWVGKGENKPIAPGDLANALGADQIQGCCRRPAVARRTALRPQPVFAAGDRSSDAGRTAADRERNCRTGSDLPRHRGEH